MVPEYVRVLFVIVMPVTLLQFMVSSYVMKRFIQLFPPNKIFVMKCVDFLLSYVKCELSTDCYRLLYSMLNYDIVPLVKDRL